MLSPGHARVEYSAERSLGVFVCNDTAFAHQHRINGRSECHYLINDYVTRIVLHDHHRLPFPQTCARRTTTGTAMVARAVWIRHQSRRANVPDANFRFRLLPTSNAHDREHDELEYRHLQWHYHLCGDLLHRLCAACVRAPSGIGEEGDMRCTGVGS